MTVPVAPTTFDAGFRRFQDLVKLKSGRPFGGFDEGFAAAWENYKPLLRERALSLLDADEWSEKEIGSGRILRGAIAAIEIQQDSHSNLTNNLVFWQNRYGHAYREHRALLEAASSNGKLGGDLEGLLFGLYRGGADEGATFDRLRDLTGAKYPLLAYLFFLKDADRFVPIQPTSFDRTFDNLGVHFTTLRQCSWENYATYNATLDALRPLIAAAARLRTVRLIDAHSFCYILAVLLKEQAAGGLERTPGTRDDGRILGGREKAIAAMRYSIEQTVRNANGQTVERTVKNKEQRIDGPELEKFLASLLDVQGDRCALTEIPFNYDDKNGDKSLLPSVDRIDSNGHYEAGNLQIVCRFVNFWKGSGDNEEFKRLLILVRGGEVEDYDASHRETPMETAE
jgi:hypothetical protein